MLMVEVNRPVAGIWVCWDPQQASVATFERLGSWYAWGFGIPRGFSGFKVIRGVPGPLYTKLSPMYFGEVVFGAGQVEFYLKLSLKQGQERLLIAGVGRDG